MPRHSTLTNFDDLHYAKIRTFEGNPSDVIANFPDQILIARDTNKVYRSTWYDDNIYQGALAELKTGGGVQILEALPARPTETGQFVYVQGNLYISVQNQFNDYWWKLVNEPSDFIEATFFNFVDYSYGISSVTFSLWFSEKPIEEIDGGFNFTKIALADIQVSETPLDLSSVFTSTGPGAYALNCSTTPAFSFLATSFSFSSPIDGFQVRYSPNILFANGQPMLSTQYMYFSGEKPNIKSGFLGRLDAIESGL